MKLLISKNKLQSAIKLFANELNTHYENKEVIIIAILKGAVLFLQDLYDHLDFQNNIEYVDISSYKGKKRGEIKSLPFEINIQNQNILIIDDICDTGNTLSYISDLINKNNPKSVRTSVLLKKKINNTIFIPDDFLFLIPNKFVVGYGLDFNNKYRFLKEIYSLD
ncbi:MAG: hypothetical protein CM1200mP33_7800 [Chloroflexota bacterium]|nr:MAG: hypothetical protein CM1200mP33_7800 [Chloroflexota bacterium]